MSCVKKTISAVIMLVLIASLMPIRTNADGQKVKLADMHSIASDDVDVDDDGMTDSYGNEYTDNILLFNGDEAYITYDLKGEYTRFEGSIVCSERTDSNAHFYVGIFADGVLVYELDNHTKRDEKKTVSIDVTGVGQLSIKTGEINDKSMAYLYFVESFFTKAEAPSTYPTRYMVNDLFLIDGNNYAYTDRLFIDKLGKVHNGYVKLNDGNAGYPDYKVNSYMMYNLDKKYTSFSGNIVVGKWENSSLRGSISIYLDDELVYQKENIKPDSGTMTFNLDVTDKGVLKIYSSGSDPKESYSKIYLYVTDTILKTHEHTAGDWKIDKQPTCTEPGQRSVYCTSCGELMKQESIPATGHAPDGKYVVTREATCSVEGVEAQHCSICGTELDMRSIDKIPHTPSAEWKVVKEATCVEEGLQEKVCTVCGERLEEESIPLAEHTFGEWRKVKGSIWDSPIVYERVCPVCGKKEREEDDSYAWVKPVVIIGSSVVVVAVIAIVILVAVKKKKNPPPVQQQPLYTPPEPMPMNAEPMPYAGEAMPVYPEAALVNHEQVPMYPEAVPYAGEAYPAPEEAGEPPMMKDDSQDDQPSQPAP